MKAYLITTEGEITEFIPEKEKNIGLDECYKAIGCELIEVAYLPLDDYILIVDEEGALRKPTLNPIATMMYRRGAIFGNAILCPAKWFK